MSSSSGPSCLVVGGGVVGLSVAVGLARRGAQVRLLERSARCGQGASGAAAGMLAAGAEAVEPGPFFELCRRSRGLWEGWAAQLLAETGVDCELERSGLVRVATGPEAAERLERQRLAQLSGGARVSGLLGPAELARLVPGIGPGVLAGLLLPDDCHVHSHRVVEALVAASSRLGVELRTEAEVSGVEELPGSVWVGLADGSRLEADFAVVCAGAWSGPLLGLPVEPIRGQIVALQPDRPVLSKILFGDHGYLLQKRSGLLLLGATEERAGFSPWPTAEGVAGLVAMAVGLLPGLAGDRFAYAWAGLRPRVPGALPLLGRLGPGGRLLLGTAHFRNGVLLAPVTAELISRAVLDGEDPPELAGFSPERVA